MIGAANSRAHSDAAPNVYEDLRRFRFGGPGQVFVNNFDESVETYRLGKEKTAAAVEHPGRAGFPL